MSTRQAISTTAVDHLSRLPMPCSILWVKLAVYYSIH